MLDAKDLRKNKIKALIDMKNDLDKEIAKEKIEINNKKSNKTAILRSKKKDLARIETIINEIKTIQNIEKLK